MRVVLRGSHERYVIGNYDDRDERLVYGELGDFSYHLCDLLERGRELCHQLVGGPRAEVRETRRRTTEISEWDAVSERRILARPSYRRHGEVLGTKHLLKPVNTTSDSVLAKQEISAIA